MKNAILETKKSLSKSIIWKIQRDFFHQEGINAWQNKVPFYVTANSYFSNQISKIVRTYLLEALIHGILNLDEPVYIVELGCGAGQFSYRCLTTLLEQGRYLESWGIQVRYVMTDFTGSNKMFWNSNEQFKPLIDAKKLDFALFDGDNPSAFTTEHHHWEFGHSTLKNPIILITNYVYDSITHDLFRFANGKIEEGLLTVETHKNNLKNNHVQDLEKLICTFNYVPTETSHYEDPRLNNILQFYKNSLYNGVATIPIGAIKCLDFFQTCSTQGVFNITSDKGHAKYQSFEGTKEIYVAFHSSFSLMVNFHALGLLTQNIATDYIPGSEDSGLKTCLLFFGHKEVTFPETVLALEEGLNTFSSEDFLNVKNCLTTSIASARLSDLISMLKLSNWDSKIFQSIQTSLMEKMSILNNNHAEMLKKGLPELLKGFYQLPNTYIPHFDIGRLFHFCKEYELAIDHYLEAIKLQQEVETSHFNIGLCYYSLFEYDHAQIAFEACKRINPNFDKIEEWIERVSPLS